MWITFSDKHVTQKWWAAVMENIKVFIEKIISRSQSPWSIHIFLHNFINAISTVWSANNTLSRYGIVEFAISKVEKKKQAVCNCMRVLCLVDVEFNTPIQQNPSSQFTTQSLGFCKCFPRHFNSHSFGNSLMQYICLRCVESDGWCSETRVFSNHVYGILF